MSVTKDGRTAIEALPDTTRPATTVAVTGASTLVLPANLRRKGAVFVNVSTDRLSFGLGEAAVAGNGITLFPSGGTWVMDQFTFTTEAIYAIGAAAGGNLTVQEFE